MKGIAHFLTGVALATFFPDVVRHAAGGALVPVLGGIAGILPDTIDFKFVRFFERYDVAIDPGPNPHARQIAEELAREMRQAYASGTPRTVMMHTIRVGTDSWRQYTVLFDPARSEVAVSIGSLVSTAQEPIPGPKHESVSEARVAVGVPMEAACERVVTIDAFTGPSLTFDRKADRLEVRFLDWHRRWTHSLWFALVIGLVAAGIAALNQALGGPEPSATPLLAGLVATLAVAGHIAEDQMGTMGSNLLYPFTRRRTPGLGWLDSGDSIPNFLTVWVSLAIILLNLDRFSQQPRLHPWLTVGVAVVLPVVLLGGWYVWRRANGPGEESDVAQPEVLSEMTDAELP